MITAPCEEIARQMGALFVCSPINGYIRIRTPFLYPDGDIVDVFLKNTPEGTVLSDLGETLGWLSTQAIADRRSPKQKRMIQDVCLNHGVELYRGALTVRVRQPAELAACVTRLSQAALRTSDLWFTFKTRSFESVIDEVDEFLTERRIDHERGLQIPGRSGRVWRLDFRTRTAKRSAFVNVLSTGSRSAARQVAEHTLASWYDMSQMKIGPEGVRFVSLFDDTLDVWQDVDFKLVEEFSDVALWSKPDEFAELLVA